MVAINHLQERRSKSAKEDRSDQTEKISVGRVASPPKTSSRMPTPPVSRREAIIEPGTEVYTVWFDDDVLGYEVNPISLLNRCLLINFRVSSSKKRRIPMIILSDELISRTMPVLFHEMISISEIVFNR